MNPSELLQQARDLIADGKEDSLLRALDQATANLPLHSFDWLASSQLRDEAWVFVVATDPPTFESPDEALMFMEKAIALAREDEDA